MIGGFIISFCFSLWLVYMQSLGEPSSDSDDCELRDTWIENFAKGAAGILNIACSLVSKNHQFCDYVSRSNDSDPMTSQDISHAIL